MLIDENYLFTQIWFLSRKKETFSSRIESNCQRGYREKGTNSRASGGNAEWCNHFGKEDGVSSKY